MQRRKFNKQGIKVIVGSLLVPICACKSKIGDNGISKKNEQVKKELDLNELSISYFQRLIDSGKISCEELVTAYLKRIEAIDKSGPKINSIITINQNALARAKELDAELKTGKSRGPLHGVPVLLKDNIDTHDMATTAGSKALKNSIPLSDSFLTRQLREAGAIILGKTNLSEWANLRGKNSTSGWSALGGLTKNPYKLDCNTCGSSAGSGAAVAANLCLIAIGTETNGSIVCPSSTNGVVGIKPTVGLISRSGIIPISFTQDTAGPMARTVKDAAIALGVMADKDANDSKTLEAVVNKDYTQHLKKFGLTGKRIAYYTPSRGKHKGVDLLMDQAIKELRSGGAKVIEIDKISNEEVSQDSFNVMLYEYKEGLNKYFESLGAKAPIKSLEDLIAFNKSDAEVLKYFGQEYLEMAQAKGDLKSQEYLDSLARMLAARRQNGIDKIMDKFELDAFIAPSGSPAWKTDLVNGDKFVLGSSSPAAQAGYPNISVPMGFIDELPVGISIFGRAWSEGTLIEIAYAYEQATLHRRAPKFLN